MQAEAQFLQAKFLQGVYSFEGRGLDQRPALVANRPASTGQHRQIQGG